MRKSRYISNHKEPQIWASYTDLMSNAFMILTLFLVLVLFKLLVLNKNAKMTDNDRQKQIEQLQAKVNRLGEYEIKVKQLTTEIERLSDIDKKAPPVLLIKDSGAYKFESGSAVLPTQLAEFINTNLVKQIEEITKKHDIYVVEIIGHTDGQPNGFSGSNLDQNLEKVTLGNASVSTLKAGSNADLGLIRALEVTRQLQNIQQKGRLKGLQFRAYSAAQLFLPSGKFAPQNRDSDSSRRRIEIRFSPLGEAKTIGE